MHTIIINIEQELRLDLFLKQFQETSTVIGLFNRFKKTLLQGFMRCVTNFSLYSITRLDRKRLNRIY